jgi:hypothetical protein
MKIEIEKPVAHATNIRELFIGKIFRVPDYQRTYAWDVKNWRDFWEDIKEGLITKTPHYWGTITLRNTGESQYDKESALSFNIYQVVDGQQRLTTIYLFLFALSKVGKKPEIKKHFIKHGNIYMIELGGLNNKFLKSLIDEKNPPVELKTNRLLKETLEYFENQIQSYGNIDELIEYIQSCTFSLEFQVKDENLAIKAFESLNDRGKPLTLLDKTKSYSMFYSSRYLGSSLNNTIKESFGSIFKDYDFIKEIGERAGIEYIKNPRYRFSEDELLRLFYHYFSQEAINKYSLENLGYDYTITTENVFEEFLKKSYSFLKREENLLQGFMDDFLKNFMNFVEKFKELIKSAENNSQYSNSQYRKMLSFLGLSAAVYPLIISLKTEDILDNRLLEIIETLDLRVYKVRGTDPRADLYKKTISKIKIKPDANAIFKEIKAFIETWMRDTELQTYLNRDMYGNPAVKYILWEFEKYQKPSFNDLDFDLYKNVQIEHIFPEEPTFSFPAYEFQDESEYINNIHRLGNLTLLEESINKRIGNKIPLDKASEYQTSNVPGTKKLGFNISNCGFNKNSIEERTKELVNFCLQRWKL